MNRSAIILAGGLSTRFDGIDKGMFLLNGKPLLTHVIDGINGLVDEIIIVTNSSMRATVYSKIVPADTKFVVDIEEAKGPLIGTLTGFEVAKGKYSLVLPFDSPLISRNVISLMLDLCEGKAAAVPRYPNREIEPLHAVYETKQALEAAREAIAEDKFDMHTLVDKLHGVRYVSTMVIEQLDPALKTFVNINTPNDLKKVMSGK